MEEGLDEVKKETVTTLLAFDPGQLAKAQQDLSDWFTRKVGEVDTEVEEIIDSIAAAETGGMSTSRLKSFLRRANQRLMFYEKALAATEAGYLLMPDFPIDAFAIRVREGVGPSKIMSRYRTEDREQSADVLPVGEGEYVSPTPTIEETSRLEQIESGEKKGQYQHVPYFFADEFKDVVFPVTIVRPEIIKRTAAAIRKRIFDEIGLVGQNPKKDPIVMGTIIRPWVATWGARRLNFFIAWWMDYTQL